MHPWLLRRDQAALVLVDVQDRLHAEMPGRDALALRLVQLAEAAALLQVPTLVTEHAVKAFGPTLEPVRSALRGVVPLQKMVFSCFGSEEFRGALAALGRKQIVLAGYETHVCVCQTALDAVSVGYQVHLARDASASRHGADYAVGVEKMTGAGVLPATAETVIFELLGRAGTDEFRALLPVIKRT